MAALPSPSTTTKGKDKRIAELLAHLAKHASHKLDKATTATGATQAQLFKQANHKLDRLKTVADEAEAKGALTVPVGPIDADVETLTALDHP